MMDLSFSVIFSSLIISTIGAGLFMFGKKAGRPLHLAIGASMCLYPYFISNPLVLWPLTLALLVPLYTFRHSI
jgi:hypothetical protein